MKRQTLIAIAAMLAVFAIVIIVMMVTVHATCSPGPRPLDWSNVDWQRYAAGACSGVL